ncbi:MAG: cyclophilin-like fold protein [Nitrososphaerota archaeon]
MKIKIITEAIGEVFVEIDEKTNPKTVKAILNALPFESTANRWGDEVYFETPVKVEEENSIQEVEVGTVAYWPPGNALCIFFGKTPVSRGEKPRAYSPVNVIGKIIGDAKIFKKVKSGDDIKVEKV